MSIHPVVLLGMLALLAACGSSEPSGPHVIVGAVTVSAGRTGSCALGGSGTLSCWGNVPPGTATDTTVAWYPVSLGARSVPAAIDFTSVALARTAFNSSGCAVGSDDQAYCWGTLEVGFDGTEPLGTMIQPLAGATSVSTVAMDRGHMCLTRTDRLVRCYGQFAGGGRGTDSVDIGNSGPAHNMVPNGLSPSLTAYGTAMGAMFGCALRTDSLVACWGTRHRGQLGGAAADTVQDCDVWAPAWCQAGAALVAGGTKYRQLSAAFDHACAVRIGGEVDCWGRKPGTPPGAWMDTCATASDCVTVPTQVALPGTAVRVAVGAEHICALLATGAAYCWGDNARGQLGRPGANSLTPVPVGGGFQFVTLATGADHTCGIEAGTGAVGCWGANDLGQLGDRTLIDRDSPVPVVAAE